VLSVHPAPLRGEKNLRGCLYVGLYELYRLPARSALGETVDWGDGAGDAHRADDSPPDWPIADD